MKAFCGGKLLRRRWSHYFIKPLTETQYMQYALDKLSILTVLPGIRNDDLTRTLRYLEVSDVEKDYSILRIFPILRKL